jgi:hypothetical protein
MPDAEFFDNYFFGAGGIATIIACCDAPFASSLNNCVAVYPEYIEGSLTCTFCNSTELFLSRSDCKD